MNTKIITRTGILLAICIVFQLMKGISVYITGPAVNAIIVIAVLSTGFLSGTIISVVAPLVAFLVGATPVLQMIPLMLPVIMFGNWLMAVGAHFYSRGMRQESARRLSAAALFHAASAAPVNADTQQNASAQGAAAQRNAASAAPTNADTQQNASAPGAAAQRRPALLRLLPLIAGALGKGAFLWLTVWYIMLPVFGANVPDPAKAAIKLTFSLTQIITALLGCAIALIIWRLMGRAAQDS